MKTTFSYFPGMFKNSAAAKYLKKTKSKILYISLYKAHFFSEKFKVLLDPIFIFFVLQYLQ